MEWCGSANLTAFTCALLELYQFWNANDVKINRICLQHTRNTVPEMRQKKWFLWLHSWLLYFYNRLSPLALFYFIGLVSFQKSYNFCDLACATFAIWYTTHQTHSRQKSTYIALNLACGEKSTAINTYTKRIIMLISRRSQGQKQVCVCVVAVVVVFKPYCIIEK